MKPLAKMLLTDSEMKFEIPYIRKSATRQSRDEHLKSRNQPISFPNDFSTILSFIHLLKRIETNTPKTVDMYI